MLLKLYNNLFESVCICRRRRVPVLHLKVSNIADATPVIRPDSFISEHFNFTLNIHVFRFTYFKQEQQFLYQVENNLSGDISWQLKSWFLAFSTQKKS